MINLFRPKGSKKRAMVFVDYESWFYAYKTLYGMHPDPKAFRASLESEFELEDIMVFGDFSSQGIAEDLGKLRNITNTIIETGNTFNRRKKDMTDFIMLDYIYQYADENSKAGTYIIFTGDGHFQSVTKYLVRKKRKNVVVYGVRDSISRQLRDAASEVRELPTHEELRQRQYALIAHNMDEIEGKTHIVPSFIATAEAVSRKYGILFNDAKDALQEMLDIGYLSRELRRVNGRTVKVIVAEWDKLKADGIYSPKR